MQDFTISKNTTHTSTPLNSSIPSPHALDSTAPATQVPASASTFSLLDPAVPEIVNAALSGIHLTADEALPLLTFDPLSAEAALIEWAAGKIARDASANTGQIYAQIGIDALPCPANCAFCSLSAKNSLNINARDAIVPIEDVVRYARIFDDAGVHLISLMTTAALPFEHIITTVRAVRNVVADDMPLLINMADMTLEQAQRLKVAGAQAAYHAHRLGEGDITNITPATRLTTMRNIKDAGLQLMNAVEPVRKSTPNKLIANRMAEAISFRPYCSGVGTLTVVPGTPMEHEVPLTRKHTAYYAAVMRLMAGTSIHFGTGGKNVLWVDAGTNPRGRHLSIDESHLKQDVERQRKALSDEQWHVPKRPLPDWFA